MNRLAYPESLMICFAVLGWWCWLKGRYALAGVCAELVLFRQTEGQFPAIALPGVVGRLLTASCREAGGLRHLGRAECLCRLRQMIMGPGLRYLAGLTGFTLIITVI